MANIPLPRWVGDLTISWTFLLTQEAVGVERTDPKVLAGVVVTGPGGRAASMRRGGLLICDILSTVVGGYTHPGLHRIIRPGMGYNPPGSGCAVTCRMVLGDP